MINLENVAEELSQTSGHPVAEWVQVLYDEVSQRVFNTLTDGELFRLVRGAKSPEDLRSTMRILDRKRKD